MDILEEDLLRTKYGDNAAYARLLSAYTPLISSLVTEFAQAFPSFDMNEDDLKQESAIALYFAALSYKPEENVTFGLYAKVCIKNRLTSYMKKSASKSLSQLISDCIDDCFDKETTETSDKPLDVIISAESCDALRAEIKNHLTEKEYSVFMLYAEGEKPADIAKKLGKPAKSVYNTLTRVRAKLKKLLLPQ